MSREVTWCKLCFRRLGVWTEESVEEWLRRTWTVQSVHVESPPVGAGRETRGERAFSRGFLTLYSPPAVGAGKGNVIWY